MERGGQSYGEGRPLLAQGSGKMKEGEAPELGTSYPNIQKQKCMRWDQGHSPRTPVLLDQSFQPCLRVRITWVLKKYQTLGPYPRGFILTHMFGGSLGSSVYSKLPRDSHDEPEFRGVKEREVDLAWSIRLGWDCT